MNIIYPSNMNKIYTRPELDYIPTTNALGRFHKPYSFAQFIEDVTDTMSGQGIKILHEEFVTSHEDQRLFFGMHIAVQGMQDTEESKITIVGRGSHDQSVTRGLAMGKQTLICSNLCMDGEMGKIGTKQTLNMAHRIKPLLQEMISRVPYIAERQNLVEDRTKEIQLKPRAVDAFQVELFRRDALNASQLGRAIRELDEPNFDHSKYDGDGTCSLYRAGQNATQALKPTGQNANMFNIEDKSKIVSSFLTEVAGL